MNVRKQLWSLARLVLPGGGFALTCMGAYLVSQQTEDNHPLRVAFAYVMVVFGILVVLVGVFWTVCHSMKSKMYQRGRHQRHLWVYTVDRPLSFPPSYEESQGSRQSPDTDRELEVVIDGADVAAVLAPPLYSRDSSDAPDCTWSWEQPPRYSRVERDQQGEVDADEPRGALPGH
ncbi:transmembrane protein 252-like [Clinocottus analis]|uniref:transmembrane protein 252-like n=1 Tax=Clinocottus analis TaxID=304258 RepID=UPI0035C22869